MPLPFIIAGAAIAAVGIHKKYKNLAELEALTKTPGDTYRLPSCCIEALKTSSNRGTIAACIGAFVASAAFVDQSHPENPARKTGGLPLLRSQKQGKSVYDFAQIVMIDWKKEAELHSEFMQGIVTLQATAMFRVIEAHYRAHALGPDNDAKKFWAKLYERKRDRLPLRYREAWRQLDDI